MLDPNERRLIEDFPIDDYPPDLDTDFREYLRARAVPGDIARERGYRSLRSGARNHIGPENPQYYGFGRDARGMLVPLFPLLLTNPDGTMQDGQDQRFQRRIPLDEIPKKDGQKFASQQGKPNVLATHPRTRRLLTDGEPKLIVIAEGVTRVDALAAYDIPAVAINGCTGWRASTGAGRATLPLPDFEGLAIKGSKILLAYDGDVTTNRHVNKAARALYNHMLVKGAVKVLVLVLPDKLGADDWIAREKPKDADELWQKLKPYVMDKVPPRPEKPIGKGDPALLGTSLLESRGDANRLLHDYGLKLLLVHESGEYAYPLTLDENAGAWVDCPDRIRTWHDNCAKKEAVAVVGDDNEAGATVARAVGYLTKVRSRRGVEEMRAALGAAYLHHQAHGKETGARACGKDELDGNLRYLGAPNGVIDLNTGELVPAEDAPDLLVTRSVPDAYDPDARHDDIDRILAHLTDERRAYLLAAVGYALRGSPTRRWYLLVGPTKGGKSTLLAAILACLGDVKARGYGMALKGEALLRDRRSSSSGHNGGLIGLHDARIATVSELPDNRAGFNVGLLKTITGDDNLPLRDLYEKTGRSRMATATLFCALNPPDIDRLNLSDSAFAVRTRVLPYDAIKGPADGGLIGRVKNEPRARQAMLAALVKAATNTEAGKPPDDIPDVEQATRERQEASIGELGQWLIDRVEVTGKERQDRLTTAELMEAVGKAFPPDARGRYEGRTQREVLLLVTELLDLKAEGKMKVSGVSRRAYLGVRLRDASEVQGEHSASAAAECAMTDCQKPADAGRFCAECYEMGVGI